MIEATLYDLLNESIKIESLFSVSHVEEYFARTATFDNRFSRRNGYYSFGTGPVKCFLFSTDQTGETAGGTGLISLVNLLQRGTCNFRNMPVTWHFAPNLDLKTNHGIGIFRKAMQETQSQLVCGINSQSVSSNHETAIFQLKRSMPEKQLNLLKTIFAKSGIQLSKQGADPVMGPGFVVVKPAHEPLLVELSEKSQFFSVNMSCGKTLAPADQVYLLMTAALIAIDSETEKIVV